MQELNIEELAKKAIDEISGELNKEEKKLEKSEEPFVIDIQDSYELDEEQSLGLSSLKQALSAVDDALSKQDIKELSSEPIKDLLPECEEPSVELKKSEPKASASTPSPNAEAKKEAEKASPKLSENDAPQVLVKEEIVVKKDGFKDDIFLENIRERILVLFEGLSASKDEQKYELTINFLEFLLAKIEDKLKN